jgi:hypothetical protein
MKPRFWIAVIVSVPAMGQLSPREAAAQHAAAVVSYEPGHSPVPGYTNSAVALGPPERFTGEGVFPSVVSPLSPPFLNTELVSIGEGGTITVRLSHYAIPQAGAPEIGLFTNVGIVDVDYPNGMAGSPATMFGFADSAAVSVSQDGTDWVAVDFVTFLAPTNGYIDLADPYSTVPGSATSDFQQPFMGSLSSFSGLKYFDAGGSDILELLAGSGGGDWIDISASGLSQVGYVRLNVPEDLNPINNSVELDAVSISHAALGGPTVPEPAAVTLLALGLLAVGNRYGRRHRRTERFGRPPARPTGRASG